MSYHNRHRLYGYRKKKRIMLMVRSEARAYWKQRRQADMVIEQIVNAAFAAGQA